MIYNKLNPTRSFREIRLILFISAFTLFIITPEFFEPAISNFDFIFIVTNFIIGLISLTMIVISSRKTPYSLQFIHWFFNFTFFFIAPLVQYLNNTFMWGFLNSYDIGLLISSNLLILLWQIVWILVGNKVKFQNIVDRVNPTFRFGTPRILCLLILSIAMLSYKIHLYGFSALFTRADAEINASNLNGSVLWMIMSAGKSLPVVLLMGSIYKYKENKKLQWCILILISSILVLLLDFPSGSARFWAASIYIGLILTFYKIKSKNTLSYLLVFGLFTVFPALSFARYAKNFSEFLSIFDFNGIITKNLYTGDFDAFSVVNYTIKYVNIYGVTFGKQLLGAVLFFIPRLFWADKPIGSGFEVAHALGLSFDNISSPLPAEGYINFGIIGVIIFAAFFSFLTKKVDHIYWSSPSGYSVTRTLYPFTLGLFFFVMRGDLLSTFSFFVSFAFAFILFIRNSKHL